MAHIPVLITDLALILVLAGITTLVFKWLKQPVVLGYIVAGFLASPHFDWTPNVKEIASINIWAEIGIIFLLFSLGLEFSFKRLMRVGGSAVITASTIVCGMMLSGYCVGQILQFSWIDSLFLGGMLSMSSTTIIIKAFSDLNLRKQKFTGLVFGVLIVEDLFAVLMMVLLTSIAVNNQLEGAELVSSVFKLVFYLIIWLIGGIYLIPPFLKKMRRYLNNETLLIVSIGLCLGMVVLADYAGFSSALGAFIMGSILAGTIEAERIEKVTQPVKDLFGAVFFVSVGMLVSPMVLTEYWLPILIIAMVVLFGQILFSTTGMLFSGQSLRISVQSGFSLAQIGEFAFIIATLGMSLGVLNTSIYPIVVAVSVITTFTTPYMIKIAEPVNSFLHKKLPKRWLLFLERYYTETTTVQPRSNRKKAIQTYLSKITLYTVLSLGTAIALTTYFIPFMESLVAPPWGKYIGVFISISLMTPFIWALSIKRYRSKDTLFLYDENRPQEQAVITVLLIFRVLIAIGICLYFYTEIFTLWWAIGLSAVTIIVIALLFSKKFQNRFIHFETRFINNLNERELRKTGKNNNLIHNIHLAHMEVNPESVIAGCRLMDANLRGEFGVSVVSIKRGNRRINIPTGEMRLFPGDVVSIVGTDKQIQEVLSVIEEVEQLIYEEDEEKIISLEMIVIPRGSKVIGRNLQQWNINHKMGCLVVAIEKEDETVLTPSGHYIIQENDIIWLVGEKQKIASVATKMI